MTRLALCGSIRLEREPCGRVAREIERPNIDVLFALTGKGERLLVRRDARRGQRTRISHGAHRVAVPADPGELVRSGVEVPEREKPICRGGPPAPAAHSIGNHGRLARELELVKIERPREELASRDGL